VRPAPASKLIADSLDAPLGGSDIGELARDKKDILVVVPDRTRKAHLREILPAVIGRIGCRPRKTGIIVATGLHRKHDASELARLVGQRVFRQCRVYSHSQDKGTIVCKGTTEGGIPIMLNKAVGKCDLLISVGVIEPHLYAGYSGGAKTVAVGLAGEETISATHGVPFLDDPGTALGSISGNPFQRVLRQVERSSPIDFAVNMVNDPEGRLLNIFSGRLDKVFAKGVEFAKGVFEVNAEKPSDIVICGIGHPKDANLYQASRAINYVLSVKRPVVRKGGMIIIAARLEDGPGSGVAEKRFCAEMKRMGPPEEFMEDIRRRGCIAGEHRAYMVAKCLTGHKVVFVSRGNGRLMRGMPFAHFETVAEALEYADAATGRDSRIYVIPHALSTIARLADI
jgi:nickel-dependent lactate racemase